MANLNFEQSIKRFEEIGLKDSSYILMKECPKPLSEKKEITKKYMNFEARTTTITQDVNEFAKWAKELGFESTNTDLTTTYSFS